LKKEFKMPKSKRIKRNKIINLVLVILGAIVLNVLLFYLWIPFWLIILCNEEGSGCNYNFWSGPVIIACFDLFLLYRYSVNKIEKK